jgi:hypothetical protein
MQEALRMHLSLGKLESHTVFVTLTNKKAMKITRKELGTKENFRGQKISQNPGKHFY